MQFKILGPLAVSVGRLEVNLGSPLQQKVLAVLLIRRNEVVPRRTLVGDVWSDDAIAFDTWELEDRKRGVLQTYVARLRAVLEAATEDTDPPEIISTEGTGYRLHVRDDDVDEAAFRRLLAEGRKARKAGDLSTAADRLRDGLALWRGSPFGDLGTEPFASETVAHLRTLHVIAIEEWLHTELGLGHHDDLVGSNQVQKWLRDYPEHERLRSAWKKILAGAPEPPFTAPAPLPALSHERGRTPPFMVPPQTGPIVPRTALTRELFERLNKGGADPIGVVSAVGAGGFGKTTLVMDACRHAEVRALFPDGILWVTIGDGVDQLSLAGKINDLSEHLSGERPALADAMQAGFHLGRLLGTRKILIVIDDVWNRNQLAPFLCGGEHCRRLITTRNRTVLPDPTSCVVVDAMTPPEAHQLLTTGVPRISPASVARLAANTGSWPLLMALVNSQIRMLVRERGALPEDAVAEIVEELHAAGPTALDVADPAERWQAVAATIGASLELLDNGGSNSGRTARYLELAVFPDDCDIPRRVLEMYWAVTAGWDEIKVRRFCDELAALSLVQTYRATPPRIRLHDLMLEYLRHRAGDRLPAMHAALVEGCRQRLGLTEDAGWWTMPADESYLWNHLMKHLLGAGHTEEVSDIVDDLRYSVSKIMTTDTVRLESDLALISGPTARALLQLIRRSAHLLRPSDPRYVIDGTLASRATGLPPLADLVAAFERTFTTPHLTADRPLPDRSDPMLHRVLTGGGEQLNVVRFSPDGTMIAAAGVDGIIQLWNAETGHQLHALTGHIEWVNSLAFSSSGKLLASSGGDGTVRLWDTASGSPRCVLRGHGAEVATIAFHPSDRFLASAGADGAIRLWDMSTGVTVRTFTGHRPTVWKVAFSPDGRILASVADDTTVRLWDSGTGTLLHTMRGHDASVHALAYSEDSTVIASGARNGHIRLWDAATGQLRHALHGHTNWIRSLVFTPNSRLIASASWDGTVRLWDVATGACVRILGGHPLSVETIALSTNGSHLASTAGDGSIHLWETDTGRRLATMTGHFKSVASIAFSPDDRHLVSASWDGSVRLWLSYPPDGNAPESTAGLGPMTSLAYSHDGMHLATTSADGRVWLQPVGAGKRARVLGVHGTLVHSATFSPDGRFLAIGDADGEVVVWPIHAGAGPRSVTSHAVAVRAVTFEPAGSRLLSAGDDGRLRMADAASGQLIHTWSGGAERILAAAWSPDGRAIASAGDDGIIRVLDAATGTVLRSLTAFSTAVNAVTFDPTGSRLAAGGPNGALRLWSLSTAESRTLAGHELAVEAVAFRPCGTCLASAGRDGTIRLWKARTATLIAGLRVDGAVLGLAWTPDGNRLAAAGGRGIYTFRYVTEL